MFGLSLEEENMHIPSNLLCWNKDQAARNSCPSVLYMFLQRSRTPASAFLFWPLLLWNITLRVGGLHGLTNPEVDSLTEVFQQSEYTDVERGVKIKSSFGRLINSLLGAVKFVYHIQPQIVLQCFSWTCSKQQPHTIQNTGVLNLWSDISYICIRN